MISGTIFLIVRCRKRIRHPPIGLNPGVVGGNTHTAISMISNVYDNQQEDIDSNCDQTGQGRSQVVTESKTNITVTITSGHNQTGQAQANTQPATIEDMSRTNVLAALKVNPMYAGVETTPESAGIASGHVQTGQDQSHATTASNTNTTCAVVTSCHDHQYEDVDNKHVKIGQGQSEAITESNKKTTAVVLTSSDVETGQGQCQAITESLAARNLSYGTGLAASQLNSLYKTIGQLE
ncbi:hypothetical protein Bbelb_226290 [Branchiostoma belcheri]|nr:hypothetical protein Bbelb_226290 [Branchiostoma belcheri]